MRSVEIEQTVHGLGRGAEEESVVVGSGAAALVLPFREVRDVDVVASAGLYDHLAQQPGWQAANDGRLVSEDGVIDVGHSWGAGMSYGELRARSWRTDGGVQVAGLPDVYASKQRRLLSKDIQDMQAIREQLQGSDALPLDARYIPHEVAAVSVCLPEALHDHPDALASILLAANGLHAVYTMYGHPVIGQTNQIVGDLERAEYNVPATYHNGFGLVHDAKALQAHLENVMASPEERLLALAADPYSDAIYGNGRIKDNPEGYDELRSADLLYKRALQLGFAEPQAQHMREAVLMTTFDEASGSQRGYKSPDQLARALVGVDLQQLSEPDSLEKVLALCVEDGFSARYNPARTIGRVLAERGVRVYSVDEALKAIDLYGDEKPSDARGMNGPTAKQSLANRLIGNAGFQRNHLYPADWTLDNPRLRHVHATKSTKLGEQLQMGEISAEELGQLVVEHTASIRFSMGK